MFTRISMGLAVVLVFAGCAQQVALRGIPEVADGAQSRWLYHCEVGKVAVEYANRAGRYTATVETEDGKQVLDVVERGSEGVVATLAPLRWASIDGVMFSLSDGENVLLNNCRAITQEDEGNLHVNFGGIFGKK
ncbi:hypothetical protein KRX19_07315 [Cardiobacteriaceae bacterium TAE3-ERU3]|nr:hypothetical protein [Cardiobacteriaceae bacterium TAE3-ERU3]